MRMQGTDRIYGNCLMLSPNGSEMAYVNRRRMDFYLQNQLAVLVSDDPAVFKLNFAPRGEGSTKRSSGLMYMKNRCCVCGITENLTRHHVVPRCYRKYFPLNMKDNLSYEVLPVCVPCHAKYENWADDFKYELSKTYSAPINGNISNSDAKQGLKVKSYFYVLRKYGHKLPERMREKMRRELEDHLLLIQMTEEEYATAVSLTKKKHPVGYMTHGELVVSHLRTQQEIMRFIILWRKHFVQKMDPKHLPENWDPDLRYDAFGLDMTGDKR